MKTHSFARGFCGWCQTNHVPGVCPHFPTINHPFTEQTQAMNNEHDDLMFHDTASGIAKLDADRRNGLIIATLVGGGAILTGFVLVYLAL
ncbi:MAG TPA: hypothetical protein VK742_20315 [Candidatus Sulfotelmatobacter sp.]|jgi:hypothetical protein|nr:hypothetical protein [Candidatus Sulfotelmatobacter sp.]